MSEWVNYRIKDIARYIGSGTTPSSNSEKYYADEGYMWVNTGDLNNDLVFDCKQRITDAAIKDYKTLRFYPCNTILEAMYGATIGKVGLLQSPATVNQACCAIVPFEQKVSPKFILYYLIDYKDCLISESCGGTQPNVNQKIVTDIPIKLPSLDTQRRIVSYLDSHVSSIDKRVSLLTTKRDHYLRLKTAIINRAVTQGLNPEVKMKDSGIKGFDYIPLDWRIVRIKDLARLQSGESFTAEDLIEDGIYPVYGGNGLRGYSDKYTNRGEFVLIGRQGALCGNINYAKGVFFATEHAIVVYSRHNVVVKWLGETLRILNLNRLSMSAAQPGLSVSIINKQFIPFPPFEEQQAIASYIDEKCTKIDAIVENLNQQIEKHKLLKRALINEVITGQRAV